MKKIVIYICLMILPVSGLFSQETDSNYKMEIESGFISVDGGKLYYEIAGEGGWIVLLHDGILHNVVWDEQFPVLAKHYKVVRYDRRGFGKSSTPQSAFSHTEDLNQIFTQLKIDNAIVFGMSAGGGLAINFTLKYPNKVNALVLVGAVVSGYGYSNHFITRGGRVDLSEVFNNNEKFIQFFGWDDPYEIYPKNIEAKKKFFELLKANPQNIIGALGYYSLPPDRAAVDFLNEINIPAIIFIGEYDIPDVHAHSGAIQSGIQNSKREIIFNAGHLIPIEQPKAFNAATMKFLNGLEFNSVLNKKGALAAVEYFNEKRETDPTIILFEEAEMNALGYSFLQSGKIKDAIELFKLNTIAYPNSGNVYDSLGEAYFKNGQNELAVENYRKSLELNPANTNAENMINQLIGNE